VFGCQLPGAAVDPAQVLAVAGVHLDLLAGGDEQRDLDLGAGLHGRGLGAAGGAVALQAGLGVGDDHLDGGRQLDVQRHAVVRGHHRLGALQQVVRVLADGVAGDVHLVVGVEVHEHEVAALLVEVLHRALVDVRGVDLDAGVERLVHDLAGQHVLELGPNEGRALTGLDVLEFDDVPQLAVQVERHAVLEVVGRGHGRVTPS
jgi:hypothetical protein